MCHPGSYRGSGNWIYQPDWEQDFPFNELRLLASKRSASTKLTVKGKTYTVEEATPDSFFKGMDIALLPAKNLQGVCSLRRQGRGGGH